MESSKEFTRASIFKGMAFASVASILWSISGTVMQFVSQNESIPALWYLSTRTLISGLILFVISYILFRNEMFDVFKSPRVFGWLLLYAVFGLAANMFTFYMSVQTGNASVATILQYLAPLFIVLGSLIFQHHKPLKSELIVFVIAIIGVVLALTRGDFSQLVVPYIAIIWGILSGLTAAFYVALPRPVIKAGNSPIIVLCWGMIIDAVIFNIVHPIWDNAPKINMELILGIGTIIIIGTLGAFLCELYATRFAPSSDVSLMDAIQPIATFILSVIFFHMQINIIEIIGALMVVYAVYLLQSSKKKQLSYS